MTVGLSIYPGATQLQIACTLHVTSSLKRNIAPSTDVSGVLDVTGSAGGCFCTTSQRVYADGRVGSALMCRVRFVHPGARPGRAPAVMKGAPGLWARVVLYTKRRIAFYHRYSCKHNCRPDYPIFLVLRFLDKNAVICAAPFHITRHVPATTSK